GRPPGPPPLRHVHAVALGQRRRLWVERFDRAQAAVQEDQWLARAVGLVIGPNPASVGILAGPHRAALARGHGFLPLPASSRCWSMSSPLSKFGFTMVARIKGNSARTNPLGRGNRKVRSILVPCPSGVRTN